MSALVRLGHALHDYQAHRGEKLVTVHVEKSSHQLPLTLMGPTPYQGKRIEATTVHAKVQEVKTGSPKWRHAYTNSRKAEKASEAAHGGEYPEAHEAAARMHHLAAHAHAAVGHTEGVHAHHAAALHHEQTAAALRVPADPLAKHGELYRNEAGHEVWRIRDHQGKVVHENVAGDHDARWLAEQEAAKGSYKAQAHQDATRIAGRNSGAY